MLGLSQSTVAQKERGNVPITLREFLAWCDALEASPEAMLAIARRYVDDDKSGA